MIIFGLNAVNVFFSKYSEIDNLSSKHTISWHKNVCLLMFS